jgi:hypothetical protein
MLERGLSNADYHARPEVGSSQLKQLLRSPLHYWQANLAPDRAPNNPSPAMQFGTLVHAAILEPDTLSQVAVVIPRDAPAKRSAADKQWWADFEREAAGRLSFDEERYAQALAIATMIRRDSTCAQLLANCVMEGSGFWAEGSEGVPCKFRPDAIKPDGSIIIDVKTTADASADSFSKSIANFGYHISAAHYMDGAHAVLGALPHSFLFLAIETEPPFAFAIWRANADLLAKGRHDRARALRRYVESMEAGEWVGYEPGIWPISLPRWAQKFTEGD